MNQTLSDLVVSDSSICGHLATLILRSRPAVWRCGQFRPPLLQGRVVLAILKSDRVEARCDLNLRPQAKTFVHARELIFTPPQKESVKRSLAKK